MENPSTPFQAAIKAGLITGLILTVITYVFYFIDYELLAAAWLWPLTLVVLCGLIIYFGMQYRTELGGFMAFGTAFQFAFFSLIVMMIVTTVGNILLYVVLDPGLGEKMADITLEKTLKALDSFGAGDLSSDQMDEMRNGVMEAYSTVGMLKSAGISIIFYAILALILGAIIKKKDKSLDY